MLDGVFVCGNALNIHDKVDYISESGEIAGRNAARYMERERQLVEINASKDFLSYVPQYLDIDRLHDEISIFFQPRDTRENVTVKVYADGQEIYSEDFLTLRPPETERIYVNFNTALNPDSRVELRITNT